MDANKAAANKKHISRAIMMIILIVVFISYCINRHKVF